VGAVVGADRGVVLLVVGFKRGAPSSAQLQIINGEPRCT
jgi:hypothetical protein